MSSEDFELLAEMKSNCMKQEHYIDPKAFDKFTLLRKLEFIANAYLLYLSTEINITQLKINNCSDESIKVYLIDHLETLRAISRRLENDDF